MIKLLISILNLSLLYSCSDCNEIMVNKVNVRIENSLGFDISNGTIGSEMYKDNDSYAQCSLRVKFKDLPDGTATNYIETSGSHLGYNTLRINRVLPAGHTSHAGTFDELFNEELLRAGAVIDSIANVYTGEMLVGLRLPDGNYTFSLQALTDNINIMVVEIQRDL